MKRLIAILLISANVQAAAPTYIGTNYVQATTGVDMNYGTPCTSCAADDIILLAVTVRDVDDTITVSGYTQLLTWDRGTTARYWIFWKRTTGTEGDAVIDKSTTTGDTYAMATTWRGAWTGGDPFTVGTTMTSTSDLGTVPAITVPSADAVVIMQANGEDNNTANCVMTATDPSAFTEVYSESATGADGCMCIGYATQSSVGTTGDGTIDWTTGTTVPVGYGGVMLTLSSVDPAGGGPPASPPVHRRLIITN